MSSRALPPIYACPGCSSVTQAADRLIVDLDHAGRTEASRIGGAGGGIRTLIKTARSGWSTPALDGCALACVRACLTTVGATLDVHFMLNQYGAKKRYHVDYSDSELSVAAAPVDDVANTLKYRPDTAGD